MAGTVSRRRGARDGCEPKRTGIAGSWRKKGPSAGSRDPDGRLLGFLAGQGKFVCKPGSVLSGGRSSPEPESDNHLSRPMHCCTAQATNPTHPGPGPGLEKGAMRSSWSCSGWGLPGHQSPDALVVSYTTVPPLPVPRQAAAIGGPFLWHYPSARADWTLSSILPCGARTFLPRCIHRRRLSDKLSPKHQTVYQRIGAARKACCFHPGTRQANRNGSVSISEATATVA